MKNLISAGTLQKRGAAATKHMVVSKVIRGAHEKLRLSRHSSETGGSDQKNKDVNKIIGGSAREAGPRQVLLRNGGRGSGPKSKGVSKVFMGRPRKAGVQSHTHSHSHVSVVAYVSGAQN